MSIRIVCRYCGANVWNSTSFCSNCGREDYIREEDKEMVREQSVREEELRREYEEFDRQWKEIKAKDEPIKAKKMMVVLKCLKYAPFSAISGFSWGTSIDGKSLNLYDHNK